MNINSSSVAGSSSNNFGFCLPPELDEIVKNIDVMMKGLSCSFSRAEAEKKLDAIAVAVFTSLKNSKLAAYQQQLKKLQNRIQEFSKFLATFYFTSDNIEKACKLIYIKEFFPNQYLLIRSCEDSDVYGEMDEKELHEFTKWIISNKIDINKKITRNLPHYLRFTYCSNNYSLINCTLLSYQFNLAEFLIKNGASVQGTDSIAIAVKRMIDHLHTYKCHIDKKSITKTVAFMKMIELLFNIKADPNGHSSTSIPPIHEIVQSNRIFKKNAPFKTKADLLQWFIDLGYKTGKWINVNIAFRKDGAELRTPLECAIDYRDENLAPIQCLIDHGANCNDPGVREVLNQSRNQEVRQIVADAVSLREKVYRTYTAEMVAKIVAKVAESTKISVVLLPLIASYAYAIPKLQEINDPDILQNLAIRCKALRETSQRLVKQPDRKRSFDLTSVLKVGNRKRSNSDPTSDRGPQR